MSRTMSSPARCGYFHLLCGLLGILVVFPSALAAPSNYPNPYSDPDPDLDPSTDPQAQATPDGPDALARLSQLFGIKRIPASFRHRTPPEYMSALYQSVAYEDGITKSAAPFDADVVRGFPDRGTYAIQYNTIQYNILYRLMN
jgi:hypothetical protein